MKSSRRILALLALALLPALANVARAQDAAQPTAESRMRDALRASMLQLRDAQNQVATLQASQAQSDQDNTALKAKVDALNAQIASLTKQSADDKAASDKAIADLKSQNADQVAQIGKLNDALASWEKDDKQFRQLAQDKENARAQIAGQALILQRTVDDRETKNLQLYNLANEILTRYEKYGLGEALLAKEPFVGLTRVQLQELVQDYRDKISDGRIAPGKTPLLLPPSGPASAAKPSQKAASPVTRSTASMP